MEALAGQLEEWVTPYLDEKELECVELSVQRRNRLIAVTLLADRKDQGITVDECAELNKLLTEHIDNNTLIDGDYTVEVSSPGLDRPLKTERDFARVIGREIRFYLSSPIDGRREYTGTLTRMTGGQLFIDRKDQEIQIPITVIQKAVQWIV